MPEELREQIPVLKEILDEEKYDVFSATIIADFFSHVKKSTTAYPDHPKRNVFS